jgi:hypothetical protein
LMILDACFRLFRGSELTCLNYDPEEVRESDRDRAR